MADAVRFSRTERCYTCTTCGQHLLAKSFPTLSDKAVPKKDRDRTSECRVCLKTRLDVPVTYKRTPCNCGR